MKPTCLLTILFISIQMNSIGQIYRDSIIDIHTHLWDLDKSADQYFTKNKKLNIRIGGIVIVNRPEDLGNARAKNDAVIRLSKINKSVIPICSVHPYDGDSALVELRRLKKHENLFLRIWVDRNFRNLDFLASFDQQVHGSLTICGLTFQVR